MSGSQRAKKIAQVSGIIILTLLFLLMAVTALGAILKDEKQLSPWGTGFFFITSGSMEPHMPVGSLAFVTTIPADKINEGDVITFFSSNGRDIVTHRVRVIVVDEDDYRYITRGDANNVDDPAFGYDQIIGKVWFSINGLSSLLTFFGDIKVLGIAIIGIGMILCVASVSETLSRRKR